MHSFIPWLDATAPSMFIKNHTWVWPTCQVLHFLGLILLFGNVGLLDLRILGLMKELPAKPLNQFVRWGRTGIRLQLPDRIDFYQRAAEAVRGQHSVLHQALVDRPGRIKRGGILRHRRVSQSGSARPRRRRAAGSEMHRRGIADAMGRGYVLRKNAHVPRQSVLNGLQSGMLCLRTWRRGQRRRQNGFRPTPSMFFPPRARNTCAGSATSFPDCPTRRRKALSWSAYVLSHKGLLQVYEKRTGAGCGVDSRAAWRAIRPDSGHLPQ